MVDDIIYLKLSSPWSVRNFVEIDKHKPSITCRWTPHSSLNVSPGAHKGFSLPIHYAVIQLLGSSSQMTNRSINQGLTFHFYNIDFTALSFKICSSFIMEKKREVFADKRGLHRQFHGRDHAKTSANFSRSSSLSRRELEAAVPMTRSNTHPQILSRVKTPWLNLETPTFFSRKVSPGESKSHEKLLVNVTVWQSIGALRVLISTHATVLDVIKVAVELYAKEGRRPFLNSDPLSFDLHFSQFTIDCKFFCTIIPGSIDCGSA